MLDTMVFNHLLSGELVIDYEKHPDLKIHITHVQFDEVNKTRDAKKKEKLLLHMIEAVKENIVPTESFTIGTSRIGFAKINRGDGMIQRLQRNNPKHLEDALIAETAVHNKHCLVTNDGRLRRRVKAENGKAISVKELILLLTKKPS